MGSLMPGWDSPVPADPNTVRYQRNRSLTREEIELFWKLHKEIGRQGEEHKLPTTLSLKNNDSMESVTEGSPRQSNCNSTIKSEAEVEWMRKANKMDEWWTRSDSAFLNEPPHEESDESTYKYAAQYHVAELATKKCLHADSVH